MDAREQRGVLIAAMCKLNRQNGQWVVPSQTAPDKRYVVDPEKKTCTCLDFTDGGFHCKHQYAVEIVRKREEGADGTVTYTQQLLFTEKVTYKQDWPNYNRAQVEEKERFQVLLADLCKGIVEPPGKGNGRPPTPARDAIFAAAFKVYSTVSTRRFMTDLREAHEKGFMAKPIHYNSIIAYLENPAFTPILANLIMRSALPLKAIEVDFACDSSGFSTSRFVRWFDHKYGVTRTGHDWVKVHLMCGVKTNVVTAVEIHDRNANDCPLFGPLVKATARNFGIREVSADKAYLSEANIETAFGVGAVPFIPFKVNSTDAKGGLWEKMFHWFNLNREEYLKHYHKRSNVESTFSMIKAKFGDHIRSRTDVAMRNEALCKVLCHNIVCLIGAMCELGIEPAFSVQ